MNPPTLLRKFISLFWLKKDCFSACYQQTQNMETEERVQGEEG